jgi:malic enzyme
MADGFSTGFAMTKDQAPMSPAEQALREAALDYHRSPTRGKISVSPTKPLSNQRDLSLAYSPGVAYACLEIERDPSLAAEYTSRANLVGVITNGTAVLGLGDIGPLAGKPVMEGKGCLFKKFAGIDVFDIELFVVLGLAFFTSPDVFEFDVPPLTDDVIGNRMIRSFYHLRTRILK